MSKPTSKQAKSTFQDPKVVYFAGKVKKGGGYREKLLGDSRVMSNGHSIYQVGGGKLVYGGPFAIACDHGGFHGRGTHGLVNDNRDILCGCEEGFMDFGEHRGSTEGLSSKEASGRCIMQILNCDAVHVYLETISCYGTLAEIGYASSLGRPIYIYFKEGAQNWEKHFWFIFNLPNVKHCGPGTETSIHPDLIAPAKSYKERYHEYLKSEPWLKLRQQKLFEAGGRCQLCNSRKAPLNVHHRTYDRVFNELLCDLIVLCKVCHAKFHDKPFVA